MERELKRIFEQEGNQAYCQHGIALALCSEVQPRTHEAFGEGIVHRFGENFESDLEVYPGAKVVRYRNSSMALTLTQQEPPREIIESGAGEGHVLFMHHTEQLHTTLMLTSDGGGMVVFAPREDDRLGRGGSQRSTETEPAAPVVEPMDHSPAAPPLPVGREPADGHGQDASLGAPSDVTPEPAVREPVQEQPQTVRLDGTVVAEPNFHQTSKGVDRIIFPLSVGDETHIITSTKDRAVIIKNLALQPGESVHLAGIPYQAARSINGKLQTREEIYAWGVKRLED